MRSWKIMSIMVLILLSVISISVPNVAAADPGAPGITAAKEVQATAYVYSAAYGYAYNYYSGVYKSNYIYSYWNYYGTYCLVHTSYYNTFVYCWYNYGYY